MKDELKRRRILKALQAECANLGQLVDRLEYNLRRNARSKDR